MSEQEFLSGFCPKCGESLKVPAKLSQFSCMYCGARLTADELLDITNVLAKGKGYRLAEGCTFPLLGYYKRRQALDSRTAGNGRLARNTLEKAIFHQSRRLVAEPAAELDLILPSDLEFEE